MTMILPSGYLGGNWHGVITNMKTLRNARRLRKWVKDHPEYYTRMFTHMNIDFNGYVLPPTLKLDEETGEIRPDLSSFKQSPDYIIPENMRRVLRISTIWISVKTQYNISPKPIYRDSEDLIGVAP